MIYFSIKRYRKCKDISVTLDQGMTVLVGANNSGKSSVLQALFFASSLIQSRRLLENPPRFRGNKQTYTIAQNRVLYAPIENLLALGSGGRLSENQYSQIEIVIRISEEQQCQVQIRRGRNGSLMVSLTGQAATQNLESLEEPYFSYVPGLAGISRAEHQLPLGVLRRSTARGDANLVLRNILLRLSKKQHDWRSFSDAVKRIFPDTTIRVSYSESTDEFIRAEVVRGEESIPLDSSGTGFLQTVQILSYIHYYKPKVLLLDEPDSHLHPSHQRSLVAYLGEWSLTTGNKIILATHSRHVLDAIPDESSRFWIVDGKATLASQTEDILVELGALDSAEKLVLGQAPALILTEDEDLKPMKALLAHVRHQNDIPIWAYKGASRLPSAELLIRFVKAHSPEARIIIHRDSDYLLEEDFAFYQAQAEAVGANLFLTPGVDLETVFCSLDHLKAMNPENAEHLEDVFTKALEELGSELKEKARKGAKEVDNDRHKGGRPTRGTIEIDKWAEALDITDARWLRGKDFLKKLSQLYQEQTGQNLKWKGSSEFVDDQALRTLLEGI